MTNDDLIGSRPESAPHKRKRNFLLAIILAGAALAMYASIFFRLSVNPLG